MIADVDVIGIFAPALLLLMGIAWVLNLAVKKIFERAGLYRFIWHRHLFDMCAYVAILGVLVLLTAPQK